jgi:hypothetical protein
MAQDTRSLAFRVPARTERFQRATPNDGVGQRYDYLVARIRVLEGQLKEIRKELRGPAEVRTAFFGPSEYLVTIE